MGELSFSQDKAESTQFVVIVIAVLSAEKAHDLLVVVQYNHVIVCALRYIFIATQLLDYLASVVFENDRLETIIFEMRSNRLDSVILIKLKAFVQIVLLVANFQTLRLLAVGKLDRKVADFAVVNVILNLFQEKSIELRSA